MPIHALGLQSHLRADAPVGGSDFERFLQDVLSLGVAVQITELDVDDIRLTGSPGRT